MDSKKIGNLIAEARKTKNMTQKELAIRLHITDKAVSKWERGVSIPDIALIIPISDLLDISVYELLGGEMKKEIPKKEVEEIIKNSVNKSINDNKLKVKIQNTIILVLSIIIVLFASFFAFEYLSRKTNIIRYLLDPYIKAENVKINDYEKYNLKITNKDLINDSDLLCNKDNKNCIGQLISDLPLKNAEVTGTESLDTIIYAFDTTEEKYNKSWYDKNYSKKGIIVVSLKSFIIIKNLEYMNFKFNDKIYIISKQDIIDFYKRKNLELNDLTIEDVWKKQVIKKLNNKDFLNSFPTKEINKK